MFFYKQLSKSLCFNFPHYVQKNNLFLARLPRISANWNEKYRPYSFQTLANISGNIKFPENLGEIGVTWALQVTWAPVIAKI